MGIIQGEFLRKDSDGDAQPQNSATAKLWLDNAAFQAAIATYPPSKGTALPTTVSPTATVTTGTTHGGEGAYRFSGVTDGRYFVSVEYSTDDIVWAYVDSPPAPDASGNWAVEGTAAVGTQGTTAGQVDLWSATAAKGKLRLKAADSAGDTTTTITNASQAAARTYTVPDAGAAASFVMSEGTQTIAGTKTFSSQVWLAGLGINGAAVTSTAAELNILDGVTATMSEINTACDGITAAAAELNTLDGVVKTSGTVWNPASLAAQTQVEQTFTATGAAVGDFVQWASTISAWGSYGSIDVKAYVSAANTVTVQLFNSHTSSAVDLPSATWRFLIIKQ